MKIRDRVLEVYPDNISTDRIVPTRLVTEVTPEKLAPVRSVPVMVTRVTPAVEPDSGAMLVMVGLG